MSWREDYLTKRVQAFRDHVQSLDEQEARARRTKPSGIQPARKGLPEGPGQRAARGETYTVLGQHSDTAAE